MIIEKKQRNYFWLIGIFLLSITVSLSVTAMILSGHINLECFYDVGEICDVSCTSFAAYEGITYDSQQEMIQITDGSSSIYYFIQNKDNLWNYLYVNLTLMETEKLKVTFYGYNQNMNEVYQCDYTLVNGDNYLTIGGFRFQQCKFLIENQNGVRLNINKMRFFEKEIAVWGKKAWLLSGILCGCLFLTGILYYRIKGTSLLSFLSAFINFEQDIFCFWGEKTYSIFEKYTVKQRRRLRILLFLIWIWGSFFFFISGIYISNMNYVYLFGSLLNLLLAVSCFEEKPKKLLWNTNIVYVWFLIWGISILSDFIVGKVNGEYLGIAMLGPMGFLFFAWHNMKEPEHLIEDFMDAIEISAWIRFLYAFLFQPNKVLTRFGGIDDNSGITAMFLSVALIMFISKMDKQMSQDKLQFCYFRYLLGVGIGLQLFWNTQSVTGTGTLFILGFLYIGRLHLQRKIIWKKKRHLLIIGSILTICVSFWGTKCIMNRNLNTLLEVNPVALEVDDYKIKKEWNVLSEPVYAKSAITESRIYTKLVHATSWESLTSSRNLYWLEFLRTMNLFGNAKNPYFWRGTHFGHNAILTMGNKYGVLIIVPYMMLLIIAVKKAGEKVHLKSNHTSIFIFGCILGGILTSMGDNVEQPFLLHMWIALYTGIGSLFPSTKIQSENKLEVPDHEK